MKRLYAKQGFSLLELLTVIAIVAILAAILFPIMKSAKDRAKTTACITHLHDIAVGLKTYKIDNNKYPDCLLGFRPSGSSAMSTATGALYPEYVRDIGAFTCPSGGSGNIDDEVAVTVLDPSTGNSVQAHYYYGDSYDWTDVTGTGGRMATYMKMWAPNPSAVDVFAADPDKPNLQDVEYARQLRFRSPDENTVVTWCMNHTGTGKAQVLFLSGSVVAVPALKMTPSAVPGGLNVLYRVMP
jgi:prepilin-type N-terminal cleavage/methylation domain-containing protein